MWKNLLVNSVLFLNCVLLIFVGWLWWRSYRSADMVTFRPAPREWRQVLTEPGLLDFQTISDYDPFAELRNSKGEASVREHDPFYGTRWMYSKKQYVPDSPDTVEGRTKFYDGSMPPRYLGVRYGSGECYISELTVVGPIGTAVFILGVPFYYLTAIFGAWPLLRVWRMSRRILSQKWGGHGFPIVVRGEYDTQIGESVDTKV